MMRSQKIFTWGILLGQAAFLLATITHVAYFFSAFDHSTIEPYAIAIAIDGFIALFSYALIDMTNNNTVWYKVLPVFIVVAFLSVMSVYINGVYDKHFESLAMLTGVDSVSIPIFGDVNTLIASCFSILILAYTFVGNNITSTKKQETLEDKVERLENEKELRDRLAKVSEGRFTSKVKQAINSTSEIANHAITTASHLLPSRTSQNEQETPLQHEEDIIEVSLPEAPLESLRPQIETPVQDGMQDIQSLSSLLEAFMQEVHVVTASKASQEGQETPLQPEEVLVHPLQNEASLESLQPQIEAIGQEVPVQEVDTEVLKIPEEVAATKSNGHNVPLNALMMKDRRRK